VIAEAVGAGGRSRLDPVSRVAAQVRARRLVLVLDGFERLLAAGRTVRALVARCPGVTAMDLYEAEARGLALARENLAGSRVPLGFHWHDVTTGLPQRYDFIVSNPPFHQGRADEPELGRGFIGAAAAALRPGGRLWLVANRHLPYEAALGQGFGSVRTVREEAGFKVTSPRNAADRGGTITIGHDDASAITKELIRREFIVDYRPGAGVRISPHFYTSDEELELVIDEMKKIRDAGTYLAAEGVGAAF